VLLLQNKQQNFASKHLPTIWLITAKISMFLKPALKFGPISKTPPHNFDNYRQNFNAGSVKPTL
jgi:hypothetical protein